MRIQHASNGYKYGNGFAHETGVSNVAKILIDLGWQIFPNAKLEVVYVFRSHEGTDLAPETKTKPIKKRKVSTKRDKEYLHKIDIFARKEVEGTNLEKEIGIEIDGKVHESDNQKGRDRDAQDYFEFFFPDMRFIRIPLDIAINGERQDVIKGYLRKI